MAVKPRSHVKRRQSGRLRGYTSWSPHQIFALVGTVRVSHTYTKDPVQLARAPLRDWSREFSVPCTNFYERGGTLNKPIASVITEIPRITVPA